VYEKVDEAKEREDVTQFFIKQYRDNEAKANSNNKHK